jgi:hypothetical protein
MDTPLPFPESDYSPLQIVAHGWITNTVNNPDYRYVLRLIKEGKLSARNVSLTGGRLYKIRGEEIIRYSSVTPKKTKDGIHKC